MTNLKENGGYSAPIVYKAFAVLQEVAKAPFELGVSDLSRQLNINKSTVFGITQALLDLGMLRQDDSKKFRLGPSLIQLGNQSLAGVSLRSIARPFMEKLGYEFSETVLLNRWDEYGITVIEKVASPGDLRISVAEGTRLPFFAGAAAKAFLAFLDEPGQKRIIEKRELPKFTGNSITDEQEYLAELRQVRQQGYATEFEEYIQGVNGISVPVFDPNTRLLVAVLWVVGFSSSFSAEKMSMAAAAAMEAAREISLLLGG